MKSVLSVKEDKRFGTTEVLVRARNFHNFGERFGEIQRKAFQLDEDAEQTLNELKELESRPTPAEIEQAQKDLKNVIENMTGPAAEGLRASAAQMGVSPEQMFVQLAKAAQDATDSDEELECGPFQGLFKPDLNELQVDLAEGAAWDQTTEARLDQFLADWPVLRPAVLEAAFNVYKTVFPQVSEFYEGDPARDFLLPPPTNPDTVADLFCITTVNLNADGSIGLSGPCTWDEEHGFGVKIKGGKIIASGHVPDAW